MTALHEVTRILLLEDEFASVKGNLRRAQQLFPFEIESAPNVDAAMEMIEHGNYALMLVDLYVPLAAGEKASVNGGLQFLERLAEKSSSKNEWSYPPFIIVTLHTVGLPAAKDMPGCRGVFNKMAGMEIRKAIGEVIGRDDL